MAPSTTSFINPSSLNYSASRQASFSPAPSSPLTSAGDDEHELDHNHDDHAAGPARKRARTSATSSKDTAPASQPNPTLSISEQRKEARAHRNRIAAQNSRDRRKAQFAYLERRVAELEEENRCLRAGMGLNAATVAPAQTQPIFSSAAATAPSVPAGPSAVVPLPVTLTLPSEEQLRAERERARERENEELKERIKTLERGWETVVKALTAQGLTAGLLGGVQAPASAAATTTTSTTTTSPSSQPSPSSQSTVPPNKPAYTAFPSPAPSHSSLDLELNPTSTFTTPTASLPDFSSSLGLTHHHHHQTALPTPTSPTLTLATGGDHRGTFTGSLGVPAAGGLFGCGGASAVAYGAGPAVRAGAAAEAAAVSATGTMFGGDHGDVTDKAMEALYAEILASPRAPHAAVPAGKGLAGAGAASASAKAQVSEGGKEGREGLERGEEGEEKKNENKKRREEGVSRDVDVVDGNERKKEEAAQDANENETENAAVMEWANEIEMQRMLDSMIMGLQGGGVVGDFSAMDGEGDVSIHALEMDLVAAQGGLGFDFGAGMDMDVNVLDMDLGMNMGLGFGDAGVLAGAGVGAGWDGLGGSGVF